MKAAAESRQDDIGYVKALTDPSYRRASIICIIMATAIQGTGINAINIYSTKIYQDIQDESGGTGGISPRLGSVLNGVAQMIACGLSPLMTYFSMRAIINRGFFIMAISMFVISVFAAEGMNNLLVVFMMIFLFTFQITLGTFSWVYIGAVTCDEGLSIGTFTLWFWVLILSIFTNKMFDTMQSWGTFLFFGLCSLVSGIFFQLQLREIKGLTRDQAQVVYSDKREATISSRKSDYAIGASTLGSEGSVLLDGRKSNEDIEEAH